MIMKNGRVLLEANAAIDDRSHNAGSGQGRYGTSQESEVGPKTKQMRAGRGLVNRVSKGVMNAHVVANRTICEFRSRKTVSTP